MHFHFQTMAKNSSEYTYSYNNASKPIHIDDEDDDISITIIRQVHFKNTFAIRTDPASSETSHKSTKPNATKFNTLYMKTRVQLISKKLASDFSVPTEDLPSNCIFDTTLRSCSCCLCHHSHIVGKMYESCIEKHPLKESCRRENPLSYQRSTMRTYKKQNVCDECMYTLTANSKSKKYGYRCIFSSCSHKSYKTRKIAELRKHLLRHMGVKKNFVCNICEKSYASSSGLIKHERTHATKI